MLIYVYINSMKPKLTGRGGAGRGQGRKPKPDKVETVPIAVRVTPEQREKFQQLGGAQWMRMKIDEAKIPKK